MAQVGRISGPLLYPNLERLGKTAGSDQNLTFSDTAVSSGGTPLLFVDVINDRIGVKNNNPQYTLDVTGSTRVSTTLDVDTQSNIANINLINSSIQPFPGSLILDSQNVITANNIQTDNLNIDFNRIKAITPNTNIELRPNGTGSVDVFADTNVYGNIDATGSITLAGNIILGDSDTDNVTVNADIASNINPDVTGLYTLGTVDKRWQDIESVLMNGVDINTQVATVAGVDVNLAQGKMWFVAQNGDNTNVGDRQQGAFRTIEYALLQASAGDTVFVYPGEYEESCPLEVPPGVTVTGHNQRNTIVYPASSQSTTDIFLVHGETLVQNFTLKDFYYDSVNDIGYGFRFAPGGKVTTRSPYVQNITVITKGSVVSSDDPRGFDQGDAGKGILVDGAVLASDTREASMLFHAVTLITPGVDALTMTNGVRVEWLNSFTYFANRGLYATRGSGRVTDNLITRYGAEIRAIGSANIYGNIGAEADGADTLMYLVAHNWGYIGTGKDSSNDNTLAIQSNEVIEVNGGQVQFQSQSQNGDFRVGNNFLIDFAKGSQTFDINDVPVVGVELITVTTGLDVTYLDLDYIRTGNIRFIDQTVASVAGDLNILSTTGITNINSNVIVDENLYASGNLTIGGGLIAFGNNQAIDTVTFDSGIDSDLLPKTTDIHDIGSNTKQWRDVYLTETYLDSLNITNNYIETIDSNANLELRANGTGQVVFDDSVLIENNLDISVGSTVFNGLFDISGSISVGNVSTVIGTLSSPNSLIISDNLNVDGGIQAENILLDDNFITTTITNSNLELRASGTGVISLSPNTSILQDLVVVGDIEATDVTTIILTQSDSLTVNNISIQNNIIQSSSDLNLTATGNVVLTDNTIITNSLTVTGTTLLGQSNNPTAKNITGLLTHVGDKTTTGNTVQVGNLNLDGDITISSDARFEDISITNNVVTTTLSNSNLDLRAAGTGRVLINSSLEISNNLEVLGSTSAVDINVTTVTDAPRFEISNVIIDGNVITNQSGDLNLKSTTGSIISVPVNDVEIQNQLNSSSFTFFQGGVDLTGSLTHTGNKVQNGNISLIGIQNISSTLTTDRLVSFENIDIEDNFITTTGTDQDLNLRASGTGKVIFSSNNVLINNNLNIGTFTIDNNLELIDASANQYTNNNILINDNTISTTVSNSNLELRASGTGVISIPSNNLQINNNLTVGNITDLQKTNIVGTLTHIGNNTQIGNTTISGNVSVSGLLDVPNMDFENVLIDTNVITSVDSNSDLELRAAGTGIVHIQETLNVPNTATINQVESDNIVNTGNITSNIFAAGITDQITIDDNNIIFDNSQLELSATGNIVFENLNIDDNLTVTSPGVTTFANTTINANLTLTGDKTQTGNLNIIGNYNVNGLFYTDRQVQFENILVDDNLITTTDSNSNLELRSLGNISIPSSNVTISNQLSVDTINSASITNVGTIASQTFSTNDIDILSSSIETRTTDTDLIITAQTQEVIFNDNVSVTDSISVIGNTFILDTDIIATVTHTGNRTQTGNYTTNGPFNVSTSATFDRKAIIGDLKISGNKISSRGLNQDIIIASPGTGSVTSTFSNIEFGQDLTVLGTINSNGVTNASLTSAEEFNTGQLKIFDNNIDSIGVSTNIVLSAVTGSFVRIDTNDLNVTNNFTVADTVDFAQLQQVNVNGNLIHTGNRTQTSALYTLNGNLNITGQLQAQNSAQFEDILIGQNTPAMIRTSLSNSNLELKAQNNIIFDANNLIVSTGGEITINGTLYSNRIQNSISITTDSMSTGDINISTDTIETTQSNSDLEFNSPTQFLENTTFNQNLTVDGTSNLLGSDASVNGTITHTGQRSATNVNVVGDINVDGDVIISGGALFEGVEVGGNYISTYETNNDLELRAAGQGEVMFDANVEIAKNLAVNGVTDIRELTIENIINSEEFDNNDIVISDNTIQTTQSNSDLTLNASASGSIDIEEINIDQNTISSTSDVEFVVDGNIELPGTDAVKLPLGTTAQKTIDTQGDIRFNIDDGLFEGFTTARTSFNGIYSADRQTSVNANNNNQIVFRVQGNQVVSIQPDNLFINGIVLPQILINNNTIQVTQPNTDLIFDNGTGIFNIEDITVSDSKFINNTNNAIEFKNEQIGYYTVLASPTGVLIPSGPTINQTFVEVGDTRWNTDEQLLETYDGNTYIASAGLSNNITPQEFDDLLFEYTLIFG